MGPCFPHQKQITDFHALGGSVITFNFSITIPDWLAWPFVALLLLYRRVRYGYAFRLIPLTRGKFAIVDPEDFERLNKHKWYVCKGVNTFYAGRNIRIGKKRLYIKMHREIINPPEHLLVDHINHNGWDNRKANLRPATHAQNNINRPYINRYNSPSKYKGVTWSKHANKWRVRVALNNRYESIGYFDNEIEAAKAYDKAAKKHHKEFAVLNFPENAKDKFTVNSGFFTRKTSIKQDS